MCFLNFGPSFSKWTFSSLWHLFFRLVLIQSTQFFSVSTYLYDSCFQWSIFLLNYQSAYSHQAFQDGEILQVTPTHIFSWNLNEVVLWGHLTNKIHISTYRRPMETKLGKVLTYCGRPLPLKPHDPLIIWPTKDHKTI